MATNQDIVTLARYPLNDDDKDRYNDTDALSFLGHGLNEVLRMRPDLFISQNFVVPALTLVGTFPLDPVWEQVMADYVTMRLQTTDEEYVVNGQAQAFLQLHFLGLKGGG